MEFVGKTWVYFRIPVNSKTFRPSGERIRGNSNLDGRLGLSLLIIESSRLNTLTGKLQSLSNYVSGGRKEGRKRRRKGRRGGGWEGT